MAIRWGWAVAGGAALGALAVGVAAMIDDGPEPAGADRTRPAAEVLSQEPTTDAGASADQRVIRVSATGKAKGVPDTMTVTFAVQATEETANEALDVVNVEGQTLIDALKAAGVAEEDIATTNVNLYPQYSNDGRRIDAYQASITVTAVLRDLDKAGAVIDAAAGLIGDELRIDGIFFSIEDPTALLEQARTDAVEQAKAKAETLAGAAGVSLGQVRTIAEGTIVSPPVPYAVAEAGADAARPADQVPIQPGTQELTVDVSVVYDIG